MLIAFTLSMPNNNSWNGKWSGAGNLYAKVMSFRKPPLKPDGAPVCPGNYYYNFGDGWGANVEAREVEQPEARRIRGQSKGFCGYDWMIDRILSHGKILGDHQLPERVTTPEPVLEAEETVRLSSGKAQS